MLSKSYSRVMWVWSWRQVILSSCIRYLLANFIRLRIKPKRRIFPLLKIKRFFYSIVIDPVTFGLKPISDSCHNKLNFMFKANYLINFFDAQTIQFLNTLSNRLPWHFALVFIVWDKVRVKVSIKFEKTSILASEYKSIVLLKIVNKLPQKDKNLPLLHFLKNQVVKSNHLNDFFW